MNLYHITAPHCDYDVQAENELEAKKIFCEYFQLNLLLIADKLTVRLLESEY